MLSASELGYTLALIADYCGVAPVPTLAAMGAPVQSAYRAGLAYLARNRDLRDDLQALTQSHDRLAL